MNEYTHTVNLWQDNKQKTKALIDMFVDEQDTNTLNMQAPSKQ